MTDTASRTLKLASWNVNGLRAVLKHAAPNGPFDISGAVRRRRRPS